MIITILLLVVLSTLLVLSIATGFKKNFGSLFSVFASLGKWMKGNPGWTIFIVVISVAGFSGYKVFEYFSMKEESNKVSVASKKNIVRSEVKAEVLQPKPGESSERYFVLDWKNDLDPDERRTRISLPQLNVGDRIIFQEDFLFSGIANVYLNGKLWQRKEGGVRKGEEIRVEKGIKDSYIYFHSTEPLTTGSVKIKFVR